MTGWMRRGFSARPRGERGQISVLIVGLFVIAALLVFGGIDVTAAQLARIRLIDTADAAVLDAADALDETGAYERGLTHSVAVSSATVKQSARSFAVARGELEGIRAWSVNDTTRAEGSETAVVVLDAIVDLPMTGGVLAALGQSVSLQVQSRARAPLQP